MMSVSILRLVTRIAVVLVVIGLAPPLPAQKSGQSASEFYLSYLAAVEKMKSLKELVPFMPKDQAAMFAKIPKELEKDFLEQARKETITGAKSSRSRPTRTDTCSRSKGRARRTSRRSRGGRGSFAKRELSSSPRTIGPATRLLLLRRSPRA